MYIHQFLWTYYTNDVRVYILQHVSIEMIVRDTTVCWSFLLSVIAYSFGCFLTHKKCCSTSAVCQQLSGESGSISFPGCNRPDANIRCWNITVPHGMAGIEVSDMELQENCTDETLSVS